MGGGGAAGAVMRCKIPAAENILKLEVYDKQSFSMCASFKFGLVGCHGSTATKKEKYPRKGKTDAGEVMMQNSSIVLKLKM